MYAEACFSQQAKDWVSEWVSRWARQSFQSIPVQVNQSVSQLHIPAVSHLVSHVIELHHHHHQWCALLQRISHFHDCLPIILVSRLCSVQSGVDEEPHQLLGPYVLWSLNWSLPWGPENQGMQCPNRVLHAITPCKFWNIHLMKYNVLESKMWIYFEV